MPRVSPPCFVRNASATPEPLPILESGGVAGFPGGDGEVPIKHPEKIGRWSFRSERALLSEESGIPLFAVLETIRSFFPQLLDAFTKARISILLKALCHGLTDFFGLKDHS